MRKRRIMKIAACAMALVFSVVMFCLPAAAAPHLFNLDGLRPGANICRYGERVALATVTPSSLGYHPYPSGNIEYNLTFVDVAYDGIELSFLFDRFSFASGTNYTFNFEFLVNASYGVAIASADVSLLDGTVSSDSVQVSAVLQSGFYVVRGSVPASAMAGMSGVDRVRVYFYTMATAEGTSLQLFTDNNNTYFVSSGDWMDEIGDKIDDQTDVIVNGVGTPLPEQPDVDGEIADIEDAENAALGGKSDEEIQQDVDAALDYDINSIDKDAASTVSGFFDDLLTCFGSSYESVLLLSLTLGLASFIIGRRYA